MTKLILKENDLNRTIIPNIEKAIEKLNSATYQWNKLLIPNDFKDSQYLKQILNDIETIKNNVNSIKDWIFQSNNKIDNTLKELESELNTIKNIEIKKRESVIK